MNRSVWKCTILGLALLTASPSHAAETPRQAPPAPPTAPAPAPAPGQQHQSQAGPNVRGPNANNNDRPARRKGRNQDQAADVPPPQERDAPQPPQGEGRRAPRQMPDAAAQQGPGDQRGPRQRQMQDRGPQVKQDRMKQRMRMWREVAREERGGAGMRSGPGTRGSMRGGMQRNMQRGMPGDARGRAGFNRQPQRFEGQRFAPPMRERMMSEQPRGGMRREMNGQMRGQMRGAPPRHDGPRRQMHGPQGRGDQMRPGPSRQSEIGRGRMPGNGANQGFAPRGQRSDIGPRMAPSNDGPNNGPRRRTNIQDDGPMLRGQPRGPRPQGNSFAPSDAPSNAPFDTPAAPVPPLDGGPKQPRNKPV